MIRWPGLPPFSTSISVGVNLVMPEKERLHDKQCFSTGEPKIVHWTLFWVIEGFLRSLSLVLLVNWRSPHSTHVTQSEKLMSTILQTKVQLFCICNSQ
jgi:hypothetical protein